MSFVPFAWFFIGVLSFFIGINLLLENYRKNIPSDSFWKKLAEDRGKLISDFQSRNKIFLNHNGKYYEAYEINQISEK